ncbi:PKD domain-containing protein [Fibrella forsythiae]|uniref:PKD domain-containing protein n=1 Tax=Fibrella forsythiae TaxID=2817061 RepID=A0ABS3JEQ4_9BACT|nr:PKD domain-containing protein [Fibrella forsythiae]MBO0947357.1 PKD domain-containing protein [Fibrella forsythiae]
MSLLYKQSTLFIFLILVLGCSQKESKPAIIPIPSSAFSWINTANGGIQFTNLSKDADTYTWDFGDKSAISTDKNPRHTYESNGNYLVQLIVKNSADTHFTANSVTVNSYPIPVAAFDVAVGNDGSACFTDKSVNTLYYSWNFGNGVTSTLSSPSCVQYAENKTYAISLTVSGKGGAASIQKAVLITGVKTSPIVTPPSTGGCGSYNSKTLYKGPEGGCYYINSNGNKTYVDRSYCKC